MDRAFFMAISTSDVSLGAAGKLLLNRSDSLPASQRIYDDLRARIVSLELPPGTTLSRGALAKHYDVSLTPIREAMHRLWQDGLIRTSPQPKEVVPQQDVAAPEEAPVLSAAPQNEA